MELVRGTRDLLDTAIQSLSLINVVSGAVPWIYRCGAALELSLDTVMQAASRHSRRQPY
jgi:hypothetical protein